jgi:gas vesicle protein GvpN
VTTVLRASPRRFVSTPSIERIVNRAFRYLQSGFSVHLRGPAGTGKTTLALHLADLLTRPMMLLYGDDDFKTSDLIGNQKGYTRKKVVDNFIHSVVKVEDELRHNWVDSRLTLACREGFTLVYDEFNRSRPEVNNVLLSALEEKLLVLPPNSNRNEYIRVNPNFRTILTSNPEEYCGVHATQDALLDRVVTINIPEPDELTQHEIVIQKTGIDRESAAAIVEVVSTFRTAAKAEKSSGLRSCLILAKICHEHEILAMPENPEFREMCQDVLLSRSNLSSEDATQLLWQVFNQLITAHAMQQDAANFAPQVRVIPKGTEPSGRDQSELTLVPDEESILSQWLAEDPHPTESLSDPIPDLLPETSASVDLELNSLAAVFADSTAVMQKGEV